MDKRTAESIISQSAEAINCILDGSSYFAVVSLKSVKRRVIASLTFVDLVKEKRFFTYDFVVITTSHSQVKIKTLTKSLQDVPSVRLTLKEMYANPDFSLFLPPYRQVSTIVTISVGAIIADFFHAVERYFTYSGHKISHPQNAVKYFEILLKLITDKNSSKFVSEN